MLLKKTVISLSFAVTLLLLSYMFFTARNGIMQSRLYKFSNSNCNESFELRFNPRKMMDSLNHNNIIVNQVIAKRRNSIILFKKIVKTNYANSNRITIFIEAKKKWNPFMGSYLAFYKVITEAKDKVVKTNNPYFKVIDADENEIPYLQYSVNGNTLSITFDSDKLLTYKDPIIIKFTIKNYIDYKLLFL